MKRAILILALGWLATSAGAQRSLGQFQGPPGYDPRMQPQAPPSYGYGYQGPSGYDPRMMQPPSGYDPRMQPPPWYDPRMQPYQSMPRMQPQPGYPGPGPGMQPPPGFDPRMQLPPGFDPRMQPPPGFQGPPPGFDPRMQPPPGFDPRMQGPGFPSPPPPGFQPGAPVQTPTRDPFAGPPLPPPQVNGPPSPNSPSPSPPPPGPGNTEPPSEIPAVPFSPGRDLGPVPQQAPEPAEVAPGKQFDPPVLVTPAPSLQSTAPDASCPNGNCGKKSMLPWLFGYHGPHEPETYEGHPYVPEPPDCYPKDSWTVQFLLGYYSNVSSQSYAYVPITLRLGKILNCGIEEGCLRGYLEPILELKGAPTFDIGNGFVGVSALLRYNFVQPHCRLVPYVQLGLGLQYNDAYLDTTQTALGAALEYTAQAQIGVRYFVSHNLSIDMEAGYEVFSNLGQSSRNAGINAVGASVGLTYYLPCGKR